MNLRFLPVLFVCFFTVSSSHGGGKLTGASSPLASPLVRAWMEGQWEPRPEAGSFLRTLPAHSAIDFWMDRKAHFAVVESPLTLEEEKNLLSRPAFQLPVAIGALAVVYNIPGVPEGLKISPGILSRIFAGEVVNWNHPHLVQMNQGIDLPPMAIQVVPREEGHRDLFGGFLMRWDDDWGARVGKNGLLAWPGGKAVQGDPEAMGKLKVWPGGIACLDASFAQTHGLPTAAILNQGGRFIRPSPDSLAAASSDLVRLPDNFQIALSSSIAAEAYPLTGFLWLMVHQDMGKVLKDRKDAEALEGFLSFVLSQGQDGAEGLGFAPLPERLRLQVLQRAKTIRY